MKSKNFEDNYDKIIGTKKLKISKRFNPIFLAACFIMSVAFMGFGGLLLGGCTTPSEANVVKERYVVVPYVSQTTSVGNPATESGALSSQIAGIESNSYEEKVECVPVKLEQWLDGTHTYTQYYLGYVKNVPIDYQVPVEYTGASDITVTFSESVATQKTVEESLTTCEDVTVSDTQTAYAGITVSVETEAKFLGTGGKVGVSASAGWEGSWTNSKTVSTSDTFTTAETYSKEKSYSVQYLINSKKAGFYRYTLFGTTDVYCIAETSDAKSYNLYYEYCARPDTYFYGLDYSENEEFEASSNSAKLELKASQLTSLKTIEAPAVPLNESSFVGSHTYDSNTVSELKNKTRYADDGQYYGMNTKYSECDKINLSDYSKYFSNAYLFEFNFTVSMNMENGGTQEFYLYNKAQTDMETTSKIKRSEATNDKGLLAEKLFNYKKGTTKEQSIVFRIPGNGIKSTMFTKFGASGDGENKWKVARVQCTTNIYKTEQTNIFTGTKKITDDGYYGLKCTTQADAISLTKYKSFLNNKNYIILTFPILMYEEDDGSQEILLYDNNYKKSDKNSESVAKTNGLVGYVGLANPDDRKSFDYNRTDDKGDKTASWINFSIKISGEQLKSTMYLRYDAGGDGGDNWVINKVNCSVAVVKK